MAKMSELGKELGSEEAEQNDQPKHQIDPAVLKQIQEGEQAKVFNTLMADEQFGQILRARQAGKKLKIVEDSGEEKKEEKAPEQQDLSKMSEAEKLEYLGNSIISKLDPLIDNKIKGIKTEVEGLKSYATNKSQTELQAQIEQFAEKHSDFETYKPRMAEIATENRKLSLNQLYTLAKAEKGELMPKAKATSSERPSHSLARPHKKTEAPNGVVGMRELLAGASNKVFSQMNGRDFNDSEE